MKACEVIEWLKRADPLAEVYVCDPDNKYKDALHIKGVGVCRDLNEVYITLGGMRGGDGEQRIIREDTK